MYILRKSFAGLFLIIFSFASQAQTKLFSITDATLGLRTDLAPQRLRMFEWIPNTAAYTRVVIGNNTQYWVRYAVPSMKADTLTSISAINAQLFSAKPIKGFPAFHWLNSNECWFNMGNVYYKGTLSGNTVQFTNWCQLPEDAQNVFVNKETKQIAYTIDNNLYLQTTTGEKLTVTADTNSGVVNGQSVHRDEFGIDKGIFFSPKGDLLAFYRMDQSMVTDYPVIDWSQTPAKNNNIKYPMAGGTSHHVTLGVYNPQIKRTVFMNTGEPKDHYLTCVTWSPDQQSIYIAIINREQNHLWLNQYDAATGAFVKTLFEETDSKYVHPTNALSFVPGTKDQFIWQSERDGYNHLYLYNTSGKLIKQLTKGPWVVNDLIGFNEKAKELVYTSSEISPMEKHIYVLNMNKGAARRLSANAGWHETQVSSDAAYIADFYSSGTMPYAALLTDAKGKWKQTLLESSDPLKNYNRPVIQNVQLNAADGTPLYGKLILPLNFDSTKKYPVIVYLYNGPNVQLIKNTFPSSGNLWYEYMAQKGFVVFTMDGRGSWNRGLAFEQAVFRKLGTVEMEDQLLGVNYLKSLPYVDASRMGVHGWSFGGFMTTSLMLRHPDVFKVGVAGGPVIDWKMYEVMYTERYMDTPQENPNGYEDANLLTKTKNLKGDLLLIHGTNDDVVVWQHSINFLKACVDNGVQVDYFVYPGHPHNVMGKDRVHLMQKISDYFIEKLK